MSCENVLCLLCKFPARSLEVELDFFLFCPFPKFSIWHTWEQMNDRDGAEHLGVFSPSDLFFFVFFTPTVSPENVKHLNFSSALSFTGWLKQSCLRLKALRRPAVDLETMDQGELEEKKKKDIRWKEGRSEAEWWRDGENELREFSWQLRSC